MKIFKKGLTILIVCMFFNLALFYVFKDNIINDLSVPSGALGELAKLISQVLFGTDYSELSQFNKIYCSLFTYLSIDVVGIVLFDLAISLFKLFTLILTSFGIGKGIKDSYDI